MGKLSVPMTRARGMGPLPLLLEQSGGLHVRDRVFAAAGLPLEIVEHPDRLVPLPAFMRLFEAAGREAGARCLGLEIGRGMETASFGRWLTYASQAPTLRSALLRAGWTIRYHQSVACLQLSIGADVTLWRYHSAGSARMHHSDHLIWPMLRFVRNFLGPDWMPAWVELNYRRDADAHLLEASLDCPIRFACPAVALALSNRDLDRARPSAPEAASLLTLGDIAAGGSFPAGDPVVALLDLLQLRLTEGASDIDGAARMAGMSVQSLQRGLRREGTDYRSLLERARHRRATGLLLETELSITEIAQNLGYSEHANFSRAFKRVAGISPSGFRIAGRGGAARAHQAG